VAEVVTEVININTLSQYQELSCTRQQLHDHIEIEQENVNTHHAHTPAFDPPHPSASEQQTEQDDSHLDLDVSFDYFKHPKKGQLDFFLNIVQSKTLVILCYKGPYIAKMGPNASG
jgi:hypothetical protein